MFRASREYYCCPSNFRNETQRDAPCLPYSLNYLKRPLWHYNGTSLPTHPRRNCYTFKNLTNNLLAHSHYSRQLQARDAIFFTSCFPTIFLFTLLSYLFTFAWPCDMFYSHSHSTHGHVITQMWGREQQRKKWCFFLLVYGRCYKHLNIYQI